MSPDSRPKQRFQCICPLKFSLPLSPFYTPDLYSVDRTTEKVSVNEERPLRVWEAVARVRVAKATV